MTKEEKERLREEYNTLRGVYRLLKSDMKSAAPDSQDMYEIRQEISIVGSYISDIRSRLISATFEKINPARVIDNFFFGEENEQVRGGR